MYSQLFLIIQFTDFFWYNFNIKLGVIEFIDKTYAYIQNW